MNDYSKTNTTNEVVRSTVYYNTPNWAVRQRDRAGRLSHGCIAYILGLPLPIVILALLWRGCD